MDPFGMGFGLMNMLFPIFFSLVFIIVIGGFIGMAVRGATQYRKNSASPVLTVNCALVTKRVDVRYHRHSNANHTGMGHTSSSSNYYVTFQVESGDRLEFSIDSREYGLLAEGDRGRLTFQGTRYQGFERVRA